MKLIKRYLGLLWIVIGITIGYFNVVEFGLHKMQTGKQEDLVFGIINLFILTPIISGGLVIFGYYVWKREYEEQPHL